jgi:hypothetical protein
MKYPEKCSLWMRRYIIPAGIQEEGVSGAEALNTDRPGGQRWILYGNIKLM